MNTTLLLVATAFLSTSAFADYIPGRTRASAEGVLETLQATGIYKGIKEVQIIQNETDGKGVTGYVVSANGLTQSFKVEKIKAGRCAFSYLAKNQTDAELRLEDRSYTQCEIRTERMWTVEIRSRQGKETSRLVVAGDPEHFLLSQGDDD